MLNLIIFVDASLVGVLILLPVNYAGKTTY